MGVTKQYLRYVPGPIIGLVASPRANIVTLPDQGFELVYRCAVGACENVYIWDVSKKEKIGVLPGEKSEVTALARDPQCKNMAVGYQDGSIRIFNLSTFESNLSFQGHKSTVTTLTYDAHGLRLVSGSKDTDVIVWDIVSESGLFRLKGHKKEITKAAFIARRNLLITSSKDTLVKFWDLETQHCFYTVVGHRTEVYDFVLLRDQTRLLTGSADSELRVWDIEFLDDELLSDTIPDNDEGPPAKKLKKSSDDEDESDDNDGGNKTVQMRDDDSDDERNEEDKAADEAMKILTCKKVGSVMRQGRDRVGSLRTDLAETIILCHGTDKHLEVFALPSSEDLLKLKGKRMKKMRKKHLDTGEEVDTSNVEIKLTDEVKRLERFLFSSKVWSVDTSLDQNKNLQYCVLLSDNKIETGQLNVEKNKANIKSHGPLALLGHRSDVRTVAISSDNALILSASAEEVKLWNRETFRCIRTLKCDYALCSLFVGGDKHMIIGSKSGCLQLYDIDQGCLLESYDGHKGAVWSMAPTPDKRGIVTGGADQAVKFWNYELVTSASSDMGHQHKTLSLEHTRTLKMDEDVLGVKFSPNHRLLAVALLDNTVKVFFADTLKFFLSLYGHKLPVLCMDISSDSTLIVTGSADRNVKIWGLDFGDCHKSIFAHDESITCIQFVPRTHLFFSGGKDRKVKQWDADNFENILTLQGHFGDVRSLAISPSGNTVISCSQDKSIRLWDKTEEPLVLEEEREMEREKEENENLLKDGDEVVPGETSEEVKMAGRKNMETVKGTERIMEAVEIYESQIEEAQAVGKKGAKPAPHPMMVAYKCQTPEDFILETFRRVRASEIQGALLSLSFSYVTKLLPVFDQLLSQRKEPELISKCLNFLLKIHHGEITSNHGHLPVLENLKDHSVQAVQHLRDVTAFNMAGLSFLRKQIEESQSVMLFADATQQQKRKRKKQTAVLTVK